MEQFPLLEKESELDKKVAEVIRTRGQKDPEALRLFDNLLLKKESEFGSEPKDQVGLDIWRARFYKKIGDREYALEILEDVLNILPNIGLDDIRTKIIEEISKTVSED